MTTFENHFIAFRRSKSICPIIGCSKSDLKSVVAALSKPAQSWVKDNGFKANDGEILIVPDSAGNKEVVLFGLGTGNHKGTVGAQSNPFSTGNLSAALPDGKYQFASGFDDLDTASLGFLLGCYQFDQYKTLPTKKVILIANKEQDVADILRIANAVGLTRDLINTPANDMGPQELEDAASALAKKYKAKKKTVKGAVLEKKFPMVHAVGRASSRPPRLIDLTWGQTTAPKVTLVGKGVVFDTGGLDIKPSSGMLLMKKDMGGAANVLGLAQMIMDAKIPVRLRVLIPAVENAIGSDAFRPSDVLQSHHGKTVEVGNTDAEGRLVLADALSLADAEQPDLLIDLATLTGAARVALGPDLPPFYVDDDVIANDIAQCGLHVNDPLWRLPLWRPYEKMLSSGIADTNSVGSGFGGSITAALFLNGFVEKTKNHIHFDIYGWTPTAKPARPKGGEAQAIRALYAYLKQRYC